MTFDDIKGNDGVISALKGMISSGKIPHALLFHEEDGGGAMAICTAFLQELIPSPKIAKYIHPDVHFSFPVVGGICDQFVSVWRDVAVEDPYFTEEKLNRALGFEGKMPIIAVAEGKAILDRLAFNSLEGGYRAFVIYLPEKMNAETSNRLLKVIEEPPANTIFLLVTHAPEKVLTTISSRCQHIRILPRKGNAGETDGVLKELFSSLMDALIADDLLRALETGEKLAALPSRQKMKSFCKYASEALREVFMLQQGHESYAFSEGEDANYYRKLASKCRRTFPRQAESFLDRAQLLIERNVNPKILFCDLVDRLYVNI